MNDSTGADEISFNVIRNCFGGLSDILSYVFDLSLQTGIFPDPLKIAKVTPVFKTGDSSWCSAMFLENIRAYHPQPPL